MRILVFHGYLLGGTGSNVYNARLAAALVQLGHEVHLLCQERHPERSRSSTRLGTGTRGTLRVRALSRAPAREPSGALHRLPARHRRPAAGLRGRPLRGHRGAHVRGVQRRGGRALRRRRTWRRCASVLARVAARRGARQPPRDGAGDPRPRHSGGEVPVRGQGARQRAGVHGQAATPSASSGFAREGLAGARAVLVGSRHTAASLWAAMEDAGAARAHAAGAAGRGRRALRPARARAAPAAPAWRAARERAHARGRAHRPSASRARAPSPATSGAAAEALERLDPERDRLVAFVGKLIVSKGVDLLLAAWPLVLEQRARGATRGRRLRRLPRRVGAAARRACARATSRGARDRAGGQGARGRTGRSRGRWGICSPSSTACRATSASATSRAAGTLDERSCSPGASTTTSSSSCCRRARRWSCRAPSRGVRHGRGGGGGVWRAAVSAGHSGLAEVSDALARRCPSRPRAGCPSRSTTTPSARSPSALVGWLQAEPELREQHARWARAHGAGALVVGGRGARRDRGRSRGAGRSSEAVKANPHPGVSGRRGTRSLRIVFRPLMSRTHAFPATDGPGRSSRRKLALADGRRCRAGAARARDGRCCGQERRRQREPDRRQAAVRRQVRLLPHARAGRNERVVGPNLDEAFGASLARRRSSATRSAASWKTRSQIPNPAGAMPKDLVTGSTAEGRRRLRRAGRSTGPARTPACWRPPCKRPAPASRR